MAHSLAKLNLRIMGIEKGFKRKGNQKLTINKHLNLLEIKNKNFIIQVYKIHSLICIISFKAKLRINNNLKTIRAFRNLKTHI